MPGFFERYQAIRNSDEMQRRGEIGTTQAFFIMLLGMPLAVGLIVLAEAYSWDHRLYAPIIAGSAFGARALGTKIAEKRIAARTAANRPPSSD